MIHNIPILFKVVLQDLIGNSMPISDNLFHINAAYLWLANAQDACNGCGGVSEGYHLLHGWLPPYPETTGYIIETFFDYFHLTGKDKVKSRAINMADWLISIQNSDGSIMDSYFKKKMVFDTGQVIFGLIKAYEETSNEEYLAAAINAGNWLIRVQEEDGSWKKFAVNNIPHTYYTRVAWSLARLHNATSETKFLEAALKNIRWAISRQEENGWFNDVSFTLTNHNKPFTHTIAYTMRGILEVGLYTKEKHFVESVLKAVRNLVRVIQNDGFVSGTYDSTWRGDKSFCCLTGAAQLAIILFKVYLATNNEEYLITAKNINKYLKTRQQLRLRDEQIYGAIPGSWPIWGKYIHFTYPNWAPKFFIDALIVEETIK